MEYLYRDGNIYYHGTILYNVSFSSQYSGSKFIRISLPGNVPEIELTKSFAVYRFKYNNKYVGFVSNKLSMNFQGKIYKSSKPVVEDNNFIIYIYEQNIRAGKITFVPKGIEISFYNKDHETPLLVYMVILAPYIDKHITNEDAIKMKNRTARSIKKEYAFFSNSIFLIALLAIITVKLSGINALFDLIIAIIAIIASYVVRELGYSKYARDNSVCA